MPRRLAFGEESLEAFAEIVITEVVETGRAARGGEESLRMEIDELTGNCYIGDVGLVTREEYSEYIYNAGSPTLVNKPQLGRKQYRLASRAR